MRNATADSEAEGMRVSDAFLQREEIRPRCVGFPVPYVYLCSKDFIWLLPAPPEYKLSTRGKIRQYKILL